MSNKPIETFRSGTVKATVWANTGDDNQVFHTTTIARAYKDGNGEWKETNSYLAQHLADLELVAGEAFKFLRMGLRATNRDPFQNDNQPETQLPPQQTELVQEENGKTFVGKEAQKRGSAKTR
jgi:hypothetical protein